MKTLLVKRGDAWKRMSNGSELTVTHLIENEVLGVTWIQDGKIWLGSIDRHTLFENYQKCN